MTRKIQGRTERKLRRGVIVIVVLLLGVGLPAVRYGPRLYSRFEQRRLVSQARTLLPQGEYRKASVALRRALELNPGNPDASRLFADLAEAVGKSEAVHLRERVCTLLPDSFDDAYAWASTALKFNDLPRAREALAILKRTGPGRGGYHATLARVARHDGRLREAQAEFATALQLEPQDEKLQYENAVSILETKDPARRAAAFETVERLRALPAWHLPATRTLAAAYASEGKMDLGLPLAKDLAFAPGASMPDRLLYLTLLKGSGNPHFISYLTDLQTAVQANPAEATLFLVWANTHDMVMLSQDWLATLPPAFVSAPPVALAAADSCVILKDWKRLKVLTGAPGWGEQEFMRLAYLSRALGEEGDQANSDLQWKAAIALVAKRSEHLYELARIATTWGWTARWEALLWYVAENTKQPRPALQSLAARYTQLRDTRNLLRVLAALLQDDPEDFAVRNNWAMLSLLLRTDLEKAEGLAHQLHDARPADASAAATYAFALYSTNRTDDALEVMRKLPPEKLRVPSVAAYYGVLLAAVRDPEAPVYLELGRKARLLPEEEQMLKKAQAALKGE